MKGLAFRSVASAFKALRGERAFDAAMERVPPELGNKLPYGGIVATGWYPIEWYKDLFRALREVGGGGPELIKNIGREAVSADLTAVHKFMLRMLSPETVFSVAPRLFKNYYDTGQLEILDRRSGYQRAVWKNCTGFDENMWLEIVGSAEMVLEAAGARHVRIKVLAGAGDEDFLELEARYV